MRGLTWVLSALFIVAGLAQVTGLPAVAERFVSWGYPDVLRVLAGLLEIIGGIGLLSPRVATISASLLGTVMVGAVLTLLLRDFPPLALVPAALLGLLIYVGKVHLERATATQSSHEVPPSIL